jgi:Aldehyde dehydrogenase family
MDERAIDQSIQILKGHKQTWARLPLTRKVAYLEGIIDRYVRLSPRQAAASNQAKGIAAGTPMTGEEWAHLFLTIRLLRLLRDTLRQVSTSGRTLLPRSAIRTRSNGQTVVQVFPLSVTDKLLYAGCRAEVWMQPGVTPENLFANVAAFYREQEPAGRVALVLGAGNVASIGPSDLAHKLFVEGQVCLFKHNPVNEYLGPFLEEAFADLIRDGFLKTVYGGEAVGDYLVRHPDIEEIHLTGSDRTYAAIVFGPGEEGKRRLEANRPRIDKRVTCELGNVSPVIVLPGPWHRSDLRFHAENIATQMINNCGFNCLAARVLILPRDWPQGCLLMDELGRVLAAVPQRKAYYPGAEELYDQVTTANSTTRLIGPRTPGVLPYTLVPDLDPADVHNPCFTSECFIPLLAQTFLPGRDASEFLQHAVQFCNSTLWGTLSACVLVDPLTRKTIGNAFDDVLTRLRYGTIGVNIWPALGYVWGSPSWGAYPGHAPSNIQSGIGTVHNTFMFDKPEKSVLYAPFRAWPKPPWFVMNRQTHQVFPPMVRLEAKPGLGKAFRIALTAMQG